jgi:Flp pilus assembly pilin Flp
VSFLSTYVTRLLSSLRSREEGQTMAEYAVVLAVITIAIVATLGALSGAIDDALNAVIGVLPG